MQKRAERLLKEWCDTLLTHEVSTATPYTDHALLCPTCHVIHGRIAELCFPLTVLWARTQNTRYLEEADHLIDWAEYNLENEAGLWYNDITNRWFGTSAFAATSLGDAVYHFGDVLPPAYKEKWLKIALRMADTFAGLFGSPTFRPVTNYYCGVATLLALAWRLTGNRTYYEKSKSWLGVALERFDADGLLFGEGYPMEAEDGSRTVDMGYTLEESLPLLLRYAELTGEYTDLFRARLREHLHFLLPDGGIDNSFGTRHNKWTWWGSRTSDGLISGLATVLDEPLFFAACERVLSLYEACTKGGLLAMPMAHEVGEPTCLHHTFAHAKALAALLCARGEVAKEAAPLPCEVGFGVKTYQNGNLVLLSNGTFRATLSTVRARCLPDYAANGGGSLNLLYHKDYGVICAATSAIYQPSEVLNQQYLRNAGDPPCMTAQFVVNGKMGCTQKDVTLKVNGMTVTAQAPEWQAAYTVGEREVEILLTCQSGRYELPVVCHRESEVSLTEDGRTVSIDGRLTVSASTPLTVDVGRRVFHQVGGLLYLPISVLVSGQVRLAIKV